MKIIYQAKKERVELKGNFPNGLTADDIERLYNGLHDWAPELIGEFETLEEATAALPDAASLTSDRVKSFHGTWFIDATVAYITEDEYYEDEFFQELSVPVFRAAPLPSLFENEDEEYEDEEEA